MSALGSARPPRCCAVLELRQYTLEPGRREALIDLFDRHFVESQEAVGITVVGQFRDRGRQDRFVWLRGFPDMESRRRALEAFYYGPVWAAHRDEANATMLDSDDVLLLKPARPERAFRLEAPSAATASDMSGPVDVLAGIYQMARPVDEALVARCEQRVVPALSAQGVRVEGVFVTESAPNTFPRLPVREGEHVLAWFGTVARRDPSPAWLDRLAQLSALDEGRAHLLDLEPTSRSVLGRGLHAARARMQH